MIYTHQLFIDRPMHKIMISISSLLILVAATLHVNAQVVKMPNSNSAQVVIHSNMPVRGLTKGQVESRFGEPSSRQGPTGIPAIYRWNYESYSVFFENNHVIHSVVH